MRRAILGAGAWTVASAGWARATADEVGVEMVTGAGTIRLRLFAMAAPLTVAGFLRYVDRKRLDGSSFYRAARSKTEPTVGLIEGGLQNDPARLLPPVAHEPTTQTGLSHIDGTISLARDAPGTATADFFICCGPATYLDAHPDRPGDNVGYAAFGQVAEGMEVVRAILAGSTAAPARNPVMQGQMLDAPVPIVRVRRA